MAIRRRQIAIVGPQHLWSQRELLRGSGAFANARGTWNVHFASSADNVRELFDDRHPDGLILGDSPELKQLVEESGIRHIVTLRDNIFPPGRERTASIDVANEEVGRIAADYFLQRQYKHFAYIGFSRDYQLAGRGHGFAQRLAEAGHELRILSPQEGPVDADRVWMHQYLRTQVAPFIRALPKPAAILAFNDLRGREVVDTCKLEGISVPEEVAVLGVDNDSLDCDLSYPPLSSVSIPWMRIGYRAAEMLDRMLEGEPVDGVVTVPPEGIVERQSTSSVAVSDSDVAAALLYIRENAHVVFGVDDVVRQTSTGRRTIEKRFREQLGRSVLEEINRVRLERAKQLLSQTGLPVAEIAARCGYSKVTWFCTSFHNAFRISPGKYRSRTQR